MSNTILPDQVEQTSKHKTASLVNSFDQSEKPVSVTENHKSRSFWRSTLRSILYHCLSLKFSLKMCTADLPRCPEQQGNQGFLLEY